LQFQANSLEIAALFAASGRPITLSAMVMAGGTGPVTLAGTLALQNAEMLASLFVVFGLTRSAPPPFTSIPHSLDLRTMVCSFGSPNQALLGIATAQMARHYGLIPESNVGLTDALRPDFQAGYEKGSTAVFSALAGVRAIGAQGLVGADQGFSFEQLVIDNEWLDAFNYIAGGIPFDEETLAEEMIASLGAGGSFLGEAHTAAHMRSSYRYSKLFNRDAWDAWMAKGSPDMAGRAAEFVRSATAGYEHQAPVCTPAQAEALDAITKAATEEAAMTNQGVSV
jgi:trimethylamine--corrinoid protein Co-methyltransferase